MTFFRVFITRGVTPHRPHCSPPVRTSPPSHASPPSTHHLTPDPHPPLPHPASASEGHHRRLRTSVLFPSPGLSTKLQERMTLNTGRTFLEFVSNVMIVDDAIHAHKETNKRKVVAALSGSAPPKYQTVYHHGSTYPPRQLHQHQDQYQHQRPQQQWAPYPPQHQRAVPKALPPPPPVMRLPTPPIAGATSGHTCFNCGRSCCFTREYTVPKKTTTQGHVTHPPCGPQKVAIVKTGRVNYTTIENIPEGEQVLTSTFSLNGHPTTVLFD
jgi:hypothetical protein